MKKKYEIYVGAFKTMRLIEKRGVTALNPKTMKYRVVDKTSQCKAVKGKGRGLGKLMCDKNLRKIAENMGLIM